MKKSKLLAGVLVASMALLGTGYAYWTDQLTVNASVQTGELAVNYVTQTIEGTIGELNETSTTVVRTEVIPADEQWTVWGITYYRYGWHVTTTQRTRQVTGTSAGEAVAETDGYIQNVTATAEGKAVTISMENFYPGSFASVGFTARNDGTIPAVADTAALMDDELSALEQELKVVVKVSEPGTVEAELTVEAVDQADIDNAGTLAELGTLLQAAYNNVRLEPQEMVKAELTIIFPGDGAEGDDLELLIGDKAESFDLEINWIQHNALATEEPVVE